MRTDCQMIGEGDPVAKSYEKLRQQNCSTLPVLRDGQLIGIITLENITEWIMLHNAVHKH